MQLTHNFGDFFTCTRRRFGHTLPQNDSAADVTFQAYEPADDLMNIPMRERKEGESDDDVAAWLRNHCPKLAKDRSSSIAEKLVAGDFTLEARADVEWSSLSLSELRTTFGVTTEEALIFRRALAEDKKSAFERHCGPCVRHSRPLNIVFQIGVLIALITFATVLRREITETQSDVSSLQSDPEAARDTLDEVLVRSGALDARINDAIEQADSRTSAVLVELDAKLNATLRQVDNDVQVIRDGVANETAELQRNLSAQAVSLEASVQNQTAAILATVDELNNTVESLDIGLLQDLQQDLSRLQDNVTDVLDDLRTDSVANTLLDVRADVTSLQGDFTGLDATVRLGEPVLLRSTFSDLVTTSRDKDLTTRSVTTDEGAETIGSPQVLDLDVSAGDTLLITYDAQVQCQTGYCDLAIAVTHSAGAGARTLSGFVYETGQVRFARYLWKAARRPSVARLRRTPPSTTTARSTLSGLRAGAERSTT